MAKSMGKKGTICGPNKIHPEFTRYYMRSLRSFLLEHLAFFFFSSQGILGGSEEDDLIPREEFEGIF